MSSIYKVKEITRAIKGAIESSFPFVWVQGQVSNLSRPHSGHLYFSLKDEEAQLAAVWFKGSQQSEESFDPLTGEVYEDGPRASLSGSLENGTEVICAGRLTVYPPRGGYQLVVELMQEAGKGQLQLEFELLKAELARKGYFEQERKMALPVCPCRIAVVTSPGGAAVHDFLRIAEQRGLPAEIRIYPTVVQGDEAPPKIAAAIKAAEDEGWAEIIVLIRGGGSLEDLWAFNTRPVVEAIFSCCLPVLCGVGHEVDVTLADLVADLRAATPSHAAQLLLMERRELIQRLDEADLELQGAMSAKLLGIEHRLRLQERSLLLLSPASRLERAALTLDVELRRLMAGMRAIMARKDVDYTQRLNSAMQAVINRSELTMAQGASRETLERSMRRLLEQSAGRLSECSLRLDGLDPTLPLKRGYALVQMPDGKFLRDPLEVRAGDNLEVLLAEGKVPVTVRAEHK